jgi:hypothetical protein
MLYQLLHEKPKVESREDRGRSQKLSRVIRAFRDGAVIHIGHFNQAESLVGDLPITEKASVWEQIHSGFLVLRNAKDFHLSVVSEPTSPPRLSLPARG